MFCSQCEQTAKGTGCTVQGVCGKPREVAALQDLLLYTLMGLAQVAVEGRKVGVSDKDVNALIRIWVISAAFPAFWTWASAMMHTQRFRLLRRLPTPSIPR
jgi:hydroxylamine reductase (hybrid-cluster protein)